MRQMKNLKLAISIVVLIVFFTTPVSAKKKGKIKTEGGMPIGGLGLTIDAGYDQRFDQLVPGYKMISVAFMNESFNIISLSSAKDKWYIKIQGKRKMIDAIHNLRGEVPRVWNKLPSKVKKLTSYPLVLPIGARQIIDIFVPENVAADKFTQVVIDLASLENIITVKATQ